MFNSPMSEVESSRTELFSIKDVRKYITQRALQIPGTPGQGYLPSEKAADDFRRGKTVELLNMASCFQIDVATIQPLEELRQNFGIHYWENHGRN